MHQLSLHHAIVAVTATLLAVSSANAVAEAPRAERAALMEQLAPAAPSSRVQAAAVGRELARRAVLTVISAQQAIPAPGLRFAAAAGFTEERS